MSLTTRVLLGLLLGIATGLLLRAIGGVGATIASWIEPVGTIWVNAIRMTVIPLVVAIIITAVAAAGDPRRIGRLGLSAIAWFYGLLSVTAVVVVIIAPALFQWLTLDPSATTLLRESAAEIPPGMTAAASAREFVLSLVPTNVFSAAAAGAMLPVLVFSTLFAFAITRIRPEPRDALLRFFHGLRDATFVLIHWILAAAPIGVFALGVAMAAALGGAAVRAFGYYIVLVIVLHVLSAIALYALAVHGGGIPLGRFARAMAPVQAVAFTSRSSFATLPALVDAADRRLHLPPEMSGFVLPLAVAIFKLTSPIYWTVGALFIARLYGIELGTAQLGTMAAAAVLLNAATPGIPSGGLFIQAPVYLAIGVPVEGIGLLIAVDAIPDMFKTAFNVTADMAVAAVLSRGRRAEPAATATVVPPSAAASVAPT
jgi:Na+/H+-dicarboxylate symporter